MERQVSMKFTHYFWMSNFKILLLVISVLSGSAGFSQVEDPFPRRLADIRTQLELLSDSLAPGLQENANFSVSGITIQSFLRTLAESHDLNIQVDPALNIQLTNNFTSVPARDIIYFICQEYRIDVRFIGSIMSFVKFAESVPLKPKILPRKLSIQVDGLSGRISFDFSNDSLRLAVKEITRLSGKNVVASGGPEIEGK